MVGRLTGLAGDTAQSLGVGPVRLTVTHAALPPTYILACSGDYPRNALVCWKFLWFASLAGQSVVILADFLPILLVRWDGLRPCLLYHGVVILIAATTLTSTQVLFG